MTPRKSYRDWAPGQVELLPRSPHEWLPDGDFAYFLLDAVKVLDLSAIEMALQAKDPRGVRPYHPRMMVGLLLYAYCTGVRSSRKIEAATHRDLGFRFVTGGQHPDHDTICAFRRQFAEPLQDLFVQSAQLAQRLGMVKLGTVSLDGTKIASDASKHKAMSYGRMVAEEARLRKEIERMLSEAEAVDKEEDARLGTGRRDDQLPEELRRREGRMAKIETARKALEAEAAQARADELDRRAERHRARADESDDPTERKRAAACADEAQRQATELRGDDGDDGPSGPAPPSGGPSLPRHRPRTTKEGLPHDKAQRNFTEPDSKIMKRAGTFLQAYNGQAVVDDQHQIIVAAALTNQPPDQQHLPPLLQQCQDNLGRMPGKLLADAGYWDERHVVWCEERGVDPYIATGRLKRGERPPPVRGRPPKNLDAKGRMRRKLRTKKGRAVYARRKAVVEPVFGQMRTVQDFNRFVLRGVSGARIEWALACAGHNLLKIFRSGHPLPA